MAKEHIVSYREESKGQASGRELKLDIANGYVYDLAGNQVDKWTPVDSGYEEQIADYLADMQHNQLCAGLHAGDPERAVLARDRGWGDGDLIEMELGTGDVHQPSPTLSYAAGYKQGVPLADVFAPPILTSKPADKYYTFAKEDAFQRALPVIGATSGNVHEISPRVANATFTTVEYALGGFVGTQLEAAADAPLRIRQATAKRIWNALTLERELRVSSMANGTANYDSSVVVTASGTTKWNNGTASDPVADIQTAQEKAWGDVNGVIMNERLFHSFQRNAAVQKYFTYKDSAAALPTKEQLAQILGLPPIFVAKMKYINPSNALDYVWGNAAIFFRMPDEMPPTTQDDIATAVTFRWNAADVPDGTASNGILTREFFVQDRGSMGGNKVVIVHHDAEVMTSKFLAGIVSAAFQ